MFPYPYVDAAMVLNMLLAALMGVVIPTGADAPGRDPAPGFQRIDNCYYR